jgi:hypothetical protein
LHDDVAPFVVVARERLVIVVAEGDRNNAGLLERCRSPDGEEIVHLAYAVREFV